MRKVLYLIFCLFAEIIIIDSFDYETNYFNSEHNVKYAENAIYEETMIGVMPNESKVNGYNDDIAMRLKSGSYTAANMVNYNLNSATTSFENFNPDSYSIRSCNDTKLLESAYNNKFSSYLEDNSIMVSESTFSKETTKLINQASIIGTDERVQVVNTNIWPYRATCKLYMEYDNVYNNSTKKYITLKYIGTGFLVGPNLLVTAGHCVYGDVTNSGDCEDNIKNPRFPNRIKVYAGANGYSDINSNYAYYATVDEINIQKQYYENPSFDYDWAACKLNWNLGSATGYYGKISNWYEQGAKVYSYGYPADKSATMCETRGQLVNQNTYTYEYNFDTVAGQSGSPVFMTTNNGAVYVCGIHTSGSSTVNGGTKINTFIFHYLNSFVTYHNYEHEAAIIRPSDYDFADAYPTSATTSAHKLNTGFEFTTTRYRTGFIQSEYIVMSPFRSNITEAYIEYNFNTPITKIEVDLTHWRSLSHEWTYSSNCTAELRTENGYKLDLLSKEMNLSTERTKPTTYTIVFDKPTYSFVFYMESKKTNTNDNNRGRLCIGNMKVYTTEGWF